MSSLFPAGAWPWMAGLGGLILGSFLNTLALSLAGGASPWRARSACPECGHRLAWFELLPLVSYAIQAGRCRHCRKKLSLIYPAGEALTALTVLICFWRFGPTAQGLAALVFCLVILVAALVDIKSMIVPDVIVLPALAVALGLGRWLPAQGMPQALTGAIFIGGGMWAVARIFRALRGVEGLGLGDVKLGALMGAFLGPAAGGLALGLGAASGLVFYLALYAVGRVQWRSRLPFAPFLCLGGVIMCLAGDPLTRQLLGAAP
jgi:leader peptidase (prepilin peptidase)/N-methyltransferase